MADVATPLQPAGALTADVGAILISRRASGESSDRYQLRADGSRYSGPGTAAPTVDYTDNIWRPPAAGQFTSPSELLAGTITLVSQNFTAALFRCEQTQLVSNIQLLVGATAAAATPTVIRFGIYTISGTTATLAISTPNDTTLLAATNALSGRAVSTPGTINRGQDYFLGAIVVTGAAAPVMAGRAAATPIATATVQDTLFGSGLRQAGTIAAQADLPASFTTTNLVATATSIWGWLQ